MEHFVSLRATASSTSFSEYLVALHLLHVKLMRVQLAQGQQHAFDLRHLSQGIGLSGLLLSTI